MVLQGLLTWFWASNFDKPASLFRISALSVLSQGRSEVFPAKMSVSSSLAVNGTAQVQSPYDSLRAKVALYQKVRFFTFFETNHGMASTTPMGMSNRAAATSLSLGASTAKSLISVSISTVSGDGLATTTAM